MLLLLAGCYQTVISYSCETVTFEVADHEVANDLGVSADDVLDVVVGAFAFRAAYEDGAEVTGTAEVARGGGPAIATDGTLITHRSRGKLGVGTVQPTDAPVCDDALEVPVDVTFATDDGAVAFSLDGVALPLGAPEPDRFEVTGDVDPADVVAFPEPADPEAIAGLALQWTPAGFDHVSLWWDGADYEQVLETR